MSKPVRSVAVIGAGIAGACTAFHLQQKGLNVTVFDERAPGTATSWGNAGLIQAECGLPYSFPKGLHNQLTMLLNVRNDIRYNPKAALHYFYPIYHYWRCSWPDRYPQIAKDLNTLVKHSTSEQMRIAEKAGALDLIKSTGFVEVYRNKTLTEIEADLVAKRELNMVVEGVSKSALQKMEPDLSKEFSGGIHFKDTLLVRDPGSLVNKYMELVVSSGGKLINCRVDNLAVPSLKSKEWTISTKRGEFLFSDVVICCGPWSDDIIRPLGYKLPIYPLRGYSAHFKLQDGAVLNHPVEDFDNGFFMGPMEQGIRITTGGEFTTPDSPPNEKQIRHAEAVLRSILPVEKQVGGVWFGHRPCTSDMKPIIGSSRHDGLWFNFGHAHSGLTLGAVSARLLSELMVGEKTVESATPFSIDRF